MSFVNYYITLPLYGIADSKVKIGMIISSFAPFNLLKTIIISVISVILYKILQNYKVF